MIVMQKENKRERANPTSTVILFRGRVVEYILSILVVICAYSMMRFSDVLRCTTMGIFIQNLYEKHLMKLLQLQMHIGCLMHGKKKRKPIVYYCTATVMGGKGGKTLQVVLELCVNMS